MSRCVMFTPSVLEKIPQYLKEGLSAPEIAGKIGCTLGTLRVKCSRSGISLRSKRSPKDPEVIPMGLPGRISVDENVKRLFIPLQGITADQLDQRAALKGISSAIFAAMLLETIVRDNLFSAVLED